MGIIFNHHSSGIAQRIRFLRGALSQAAFANRLGISQTDISRYESSSRIPPMSLLISIAKEFRVSLDWLVFGNHDQSTQTIVSEPSLQTDEDRQLMVLIRKLDRKDRTLISELARRLADSTRHSSD
ncbi:MAG: helix-turn-helix domain-containing protein [Leptospirillum sp.]|jgi:transcriptional regulator with XRE-family HTH domain|nr:helix-turn-helix transcriptional regulator [Nitrospiraceae bacterium]